LLLALAAFGAAPLLAQAPQFPVFRTGTDVVGVDVIARDKNVLFVNDLALDDYSSAVAAWKTSARTFEPVYFDLVGSRTRRTARRRSNTTNAISRSAARTPMPRGRGSRG